MAYVNNSVYFESGGVNRDNDFLTYHSTNSASNDMMAVQSDDINCLGVKYADT